ncbi:cytidylyltransferase domain-containing protein [Cohaesibacter gelatinilyticus]|uniref:N-acylneuraminate cytidylyltransferase n=1 Tax=Cohaesibacter gelatinilyticus TaxID=372072 RepID=A0A285PFR9_9HYPH|nr:acylneuraminate cytidylyltransferase family protein [Cohaesibacter gelatinilyticus]SNZ20133.1 N-acylneuraminate cytidylyltransferase [Cohaesibacter gelatinilyticus]
MTYEAMIFARGGSKGLPRKNIRPLMGKPLLVWSIEHALAVPGIDRVLVSTDCEDIAAVARECGAWVPFLRPAELAADESPEWLAWRHALQFLLETEGVMPHAMLSVPATAPLRLPKDLQSCLMEYEKGDCDVVLTMTDAHRSPYFNMVKSNDDGTVSRVIEPDGNIARRQDTPVVYDLATVGYVLNTEFVMNNNAIFDGRVHSVYIPIERSVDIDTLLDFQIAELLLQSR